MGAVPETIKIFALVDISALWWSCAAYINAALEKRDPGYCIDLQEFREVASCAEDILP